MAASSSTSSSTDPAALVAAPNSRVPSAAAKPSPEAIIQPHQRDPLCVKIREQTLCVTRTALESALGWTPNSTEYEELVKKLDVEKAESVCADFSPASTSGEKTNLDTQPAVIFLRPGDTLSTVPDVSAEKLHDELSRELRDAATGIGLLGDEQASTRNAKMPGDGSANDKTATSKSSTTEMSSSTTEPHQGLRADGPLQCVVQKQLQLDGNEAHPDEYEQFAAPLLETSRKVCDFSERVDQCMERKQQVLDGIAGARKKFKFLEHIMERQMQVSVPDLVDTDAPSIVSDAITRAGGVGIRFLLTKMGGVEMARGTALTVATSGKMPAARLINVCETLESVVRQYAVLGETDFLVSAVKQLEQQFPLPQNTFDRRPRYREEPVLLSSVPENQYGLKWTGQALEEERDARALERNTDPHLLRFSSLHTFLYYYEEDVPIREWTSFAGVLNLRVCLYSGDIVHCQILGDRERRSKHARSLLATDDVEQDCIDLGSSWAIDFGFLNRGVQFIFSTGMMPPFPRAFPTTDADGTVSDKYTKVELFQVEPDDSEAELSESARQEEEQSDYSSSCSSGSELSEHEDDSASPRTARKSKGALLLRFFNSTTPSRSAVAQGKKTAQRKKTAVAQQRTPAKRVLMHFKTREQAAKLYEELQLVRKIVCDYADTSAFKDILTGKNCEGLEWKHVFRGEAHTFEPENVKFLIEELRETPSAEPSFDENSTSLVEDENNPSISGDASAEVAASARTTSGRTGRPSEKLLPDDEAGDAAPATSVSPSSVAAGAPVLGPETGEPTPGGDDDPGILRADQTWLDVATAVFEKRRRKKEPMREPIEIKCVFPQL